METITDAGRRALPPVPWSPAARDTRPPLVHRPPVPRSAASGTDPEQAFVTALRAAAPRFAAAAGAATAVVAEAVPPARHRRARCRVVLLTAAGAEREVAFAGAAGRPTPRGAAAFTDGIAGWLAAAGEVTGKAARALPTPRSPAAGAVDVPAWLAAR